MAGNTLVTPADAEKKFDDGDVYCCASGEYLGEIETPHLHINPKNALHLQVFHNGHWMVYQLIAIEKLGEEDAEGTD